MFKRFVVVIVDGGKFRGREVQRGYKEKGFVYLRSNELGSDLSLVIRCVVCFIFSFRFAFRVQRESKCKRLKQIFKVLWVGVKGEGMVKLLGGESRYIRKVKLIRGFSISCQ